jgi:KDO2-lipid IV(A) lauroyltransferase
VRSPAGRLRTRTLIAASWVVCHLPEGPLVRLAEFGGDLWYRRSPERAAQARRNLRRVCRALAAEGRGSPAVRAAATDPRALERLVHSAFRHYARYYLEVARTPAIRAADLERRLVVETPDVVEAAFSGDDRMVFVGLHFGAIELPALFLVSRTGRAVAPMETIDDPDLQAWFIRTRGASGVRIVGLREARRELTAALRDGVPIGLVGDRDITGGGTEVALFGAPAALPIGPALLAVESGAPTYVAAVRRGTAGQYRGRLERITVQENGSRRERVEATMAELARAFERVIEDAPDQWWAVFFPIWADLEDAASPA